MPPIFADLDAAGWSVVIASASVGIGGIVMGAINTILSYKDRRRTAEEKLEERKQDDLREDAKIERDRHAAEKVEQVSRKADVAAVKVAEVKTTLEGVTAAQDAKLDGIAAVGNAVHVLVNSQFSAQLKVAAVALRRVADLTRHPDDDNAAGLAEKLLHEHEAKQHVVDSGGSVAVAVTSIAPAAVQKIAEEVVGRTTK